MHSYYFKIIYFYEKMFNFYLSKIFFAAKTASCKMLVGFKCDYKLNKKSSQT